MLSPITLAEKRGDHNVARRILKRARRTTWRTNYTSRKQAMDRQARLMMAEAVKKLVGLGRPLFAICIGLQVLLSVTEEGGEYKCLDIIPGRVKKLPDGLKIPHMGWNQVRQLKSHAIFTNIEDNTNFYFVHSYYAQPQDSLVVAGVTGYGVDFCSMIIRDNVFATQFHPEKSGEAGLTMYSNFLEMVCA